MNTGSYTYHRPKSLTEACELGRECGDSGRFFAGGTELLVDLQTGRDTAEHIISLRDIDELRQIEIDGSVLRIGGMASLADVATTSAVREHFLVLAEAAEMMAGVQIRNQGTIGGNFCRAVPCADTPPSCIAGNAQVELFGTGGKRTVAADEFFTGPRQTVRQADEILTAILIPEQPDSSAGSYQRFALRGSQALAVAAVAAVVTLDKNIIKSARVVLNSVAPVPLFVPECSQLLDGKKPTSTLFTKAAKAAAAAAQPIDDIRGTAEFRRELVEVLTVRALEEATGRAGGDPS